jgi:hypothetical protein
LHFVVSRPANWIINIAILCLIVASYAANREGLYVAERLVTGLLVLGMGGIVVFGILKLKQMQMDYTRRYPPEDEK